jgi:chromosome segregation ATPase
MRASYEGEISTLKNQVHSHQPTLEQLKKELEEAKTENKSLRTLVFELNGKIAEVERENLKLKGLPPSEPT